MIDLITTSNALALSERDDLSSLMTEASGLRDEGFGNSVTYSRKIFIPLTQLCRDVCHYCTFAQAPKKVANPFLSVDEVLVLARQGKTMGCKEALFTLGEKPELRYKVAKDALSVMGYSTTLEYLSDVSRAVFEETGLLPHMNPGTMTLDECEMLRKFSPSMGIMLESVSERLCEKGMPHYGSPDKAPQIRLDTLRNAGKARIPFTTGILIGIGETRLERIESLLAIREVHLEFGHIQEIIIQNFRAKPGTKMKDSPDPDLREMLWTLSIARIIFGSEMSIQAPPNLSPESLPLLIDAGINDWGGVSPLTPDHVNPEAPWPHLSKLVDDTYAAGKFLHERLTIYPSYIQDSSSWVDERFQTPLIQMVDAEGYPRTDEWSPGDLVEPPKEVIDAITRDPKHVSRNISKLLELSLSGELLSDKQIERLFKARGDDFSAVCQAANDLRKEANGNDVSFVVNRNINYTNVCYFKCQFCAFSKGKLSEDLRGKPYDLDHSEIQRRVHEAWARGATEVCMQGGIHPQYTGDTYIKILKTVKDAEPFMHIHAFSPLEVWQGAATLELGLEEYLLLLKNAGLDTLPGTAGEVLDDEVRSIICPDKINTEEWFKVMRAAHKVGFKTTSTIMYGHVDKPIHWARHVRRLRDAQIETGGFTEFVPLPFVHMEAPLYLKGKARQGPTFRESVLMHAVSRIVLDKFIPNIQTSWVKMGHTGVIACLNAGANDLGGTLMNESITRSAGASYGQETSPELMMEMIASAGRVARQRTTSYGEVPGDRIKAGRNAGVLTDIVNTPAPKYERTARRVLQRSSVSLEKT
jgi:FO synthase